MAPTSLKTGRGEFHRSNRLPKTHRLKRRKLIQSLFDQGNPDTNTISSGSVRLLFRFTASDSVGKSVPVQVGFAVRKHSGNAAVRNRTKRILREVYRTNQHPLIEALADKRDVLTLMIVLRHLPQDDSVVRRDLQEALSRLAAAIDGTRDSIGDTGLFPETKGLKRN